MPKIRRLLAIEALGDEIKDEIDRLHDVVNPRRRRELATELLEYIQLHYYDTYS